MGAKGMVFQECAHHKTGNGKYLHRIGGSHFLHLLGLQESL